MTTALEHHFAVAVPSVDEELAAGGVHGCCVHISCRGLRAARRDVRPALAGEVVRPQIVEHHFDVDKLIDAYGNCPGEFLQYCFQLMKPVQNLAEKYLTFCDNLDDQASL